MTDSTVSKKRTSTLGDRLAHLDLARRAKPSDLPGLLRHALCEADSIAAAEDIRRIRERDLAAIADRLVQTEEHQRLEAAKEALKVAKKKALDVPEVRDAKAVLTIAKAAVSALPDAVEAKRLAKEIASDVETIRTRRRSLVEGIFRRQAPTIFVDAAAPALPGLEAAVVSGPEPLAPHARPSDVEMLPREVFSAGPPAPSSTFGEGLETPTSGLPTGG